MRVLFKFYGNLVNYFGEKAIIDVEEGVTVQEALMRLKLVDGKPAYTSIFLNTHLQMLIIFISGKPASLNTRLRGEKVEVLVLPPILGGTVWFRLNKGLPGFMSNLVRGKYLY